ncbi:hypothetical protein Q5P01_011248 [Channa striata]|uniref:Uncharacterized protein n=1 Tax=Channa striata TaxID=64152 RepID=A0AA88SVH6_CHASR|nr:hypothetical protein Q5P01_011248 [Channa striata]
MNLNVRHFGGVSVGRGGVVRTEVEEVKEVQPSSPQPPPLSRPLPHLDTVSPLHPWSLLHPPTSVATGSSPEPQRDLGDRSNEDVSTRNALITRRAKGETDMDLARTTSPQTLCAR